MLKVFGTVAGFWLCVVVFLVAVAAHHVLAHLFTFAYLTVVAITLPFAWAWLEQYKLTASIAARADAAEGKVWTRVLLHIEGAKSAILMGLSSAFFTVQDWFGTTFHTLTGLQPSDLDPFKDVGLLHTFFSADVVPKIAAGITFFAALLHIKATMKAAAIVPAPGTAVALPGAPVA